MANTQDRIKHLFEQLEKLSHRQEAFGKAIQMLREEIYRLQADEKHLDQTLESQKKEVPEVTDSFELKQEQIEMEYKTPPLQKEVNVLVNSINKKGAFLDKKSSFEKFIGENLINKIGIIILVIGVSFGVKYSIDHQLISPLTRIILGYLAGASLLGFAIHLKPNYENFSAVLLSGAIAILYFITFSAYSFYDLIPQGLAFTLMVLFTAFTVLAALAYNKQVIALIGLTGAYAVPFLLSTGTGQVVILFSYVAIINIGILFIAVKKYWQALFYVGFGLTWMMFFSWFAFDYEYEQDFSLAFTFLIIFFLIFYATFLANKMFNNEKFAGSDIVLLFMNSFVFYGIGYALLSQYDTGQQLLGVFTLGNAILHFAASYIVYQRKLADRNVQYLISGLVLVFITIAIPVQLDGNWVTLLWAGEATLLFWLGRTNNVPIYEKLSYPLMILAAFSLAQDWELSYHRYYFVDEAKQLYPIFNVQFLSSAIFIGLFAFINWVDRSTKYELPHFRKNKFLAAFSYIIPAILLIALYTSLKLEIEYYWQQLYQSSIIPLPETGLDAYVETHKNTDLLKFKSIWVTNYSLLFLALLSYVNIKKLKSRELGTINMVLNLIIISVFLTQSLYDFSDLRESYLNQNLAEYYKISSFNIGIRYLSFVFLGILLYACYQYTRQKFLSDKYKKVFDLIFHIIILWVVSSELIHWLHIAGSPENYKTGLSILWASYSLVLIALGIWKNKAHWRIGAMALFGITLIKLFFYDISQLDTISKTIVFISLGVLLLITSFLYNKYKHLIFEKEEE